MMFKYKIDNHEIKKLTKGEGHKVKGQGQLCNFEKSCFNYISWSNDSIWTTLTHKIDIR